MKAVILAGGLGTYTYAWTGPNNFTATTQDISNIAAGNYIVAITDLNGCKDTVAVQIFVNPVPNLKLIATPNVVCKGSTTQVSAVNQLSGILTNYAWNKNVLPNKSFDPIQTQYFTVTATDANGCIKKDSILVTVNPIPVIANKTAVLAKPKATNVNG